MWGPLDKEQAPTVTLQCPKLWWLSICSLDPDEQLHRPLTTEVHYTNQVIKALGCPQKSCESPAYSSESIQSGKWGSFTIQSTEKSLSSWIYRKSHSCSASTDATVSGGPREGGPIRPAWSQILKVKTPLPSKSWFVRVSKRQDISKSKSGFYIFWLARVPAHKLL